jgi:hypothetical protein
MSRLALVLCALLGMVSPALATLSPRRTEAPGPIPQARAHLIPKLTAKEPRAEYQVTDRTEVLLNGRPCRYQDVPGTASIVLMEVSPDKTTILKIHFRANTKITQGR